MSEHTVANTSQEESEEDAAPDVGLTPDRLNWLRRRLAVRALTRRGKLGPKGAQEAVRAYLESDEPLRAIAKRLNVTDSTIRYHVARYLKKHGIGPDFQ